MRGGTVYLSLCWSVGTGIEDERMYLSLCWSVGMGIEDERRYSISILVLECRYRYRG